MEELLIAAGGLLSVASGVLLGRLSRSKQVIPFLPPTDHEHEWTTYTHRGWHCSHCGAISKNPKGG